jgi:signal transduction histidine kinase
MAFAGDLLPSAVDNLVENAIEHNDRERPHVQVTVERATTDGVSHVEIRVADDGPGIPDTDRRLLVGDPDARLEEATGLGLWLVNWIVTESGGSVSYAPNEPRGSVVTVRLPTEGDGDDGRDDGRRLDTTHRTPRRVPIDGRAGDTAAPQTRSGPSSNANGAS